MQEDYKEMLAGWSNMAAFKDLQATLRMIPEAQQAEQTKKIDVFLKAAQQENAKMFKRWVSLQNLAFLASFSEVETVKIVCRSLLGLPIQLDNQPVFKSPNHHRDIHLGCFEEFVKNALEGHTARTLKHPHIQKNMALIEKISEGFNLWDRGDPLTKSLRTATLVSYGAFFTNTQGAERANKEHNLCAENLQGEKNVSKRLIASARIKEVCNAAVIGEKKRISRGKKKIVQNIRRVIAVHEDVEELRRSMGCKAYDLLYKELKVKLDDTWQSTRVSKEKEKFEEAFAFTHVAPAKELYEGFDISPLLDRKLFTKGDNLTLLRTELTKRRENNSDCTEIVLILKMAITDVKKGIKKHVFLRDRKGPRYDDRFFKVLYTPIDDYEYSIV
jgi:hypothetical protein